jgi:uncharacterized protein YqgV (UPF0045/DUF77 family)
MTVSAQVSIYPLRQERLTPAIDAVGQALRDHGLAPQEGPMSTYVVGEDGSVFDGLREAFARATQLGHVVMTMTISNACPIPDRSHDDGRRR